LGLWKTELGKINEKAGQSLADPTQYENLFPGFQDALKVQQFLKQDELLPACAFTQIPLNIERNAVDEMQSGEQIGNFKYSKLDKPQNGSASQSELTETMKKISLDETAEVKQDAPEKTRKNSLDEFDFDEDIDENIDTSDVNLDEDEELLSD
jgi:coatomer subunit beta'